MADPRQVARISRVLLGICFMGEALLATVFWQRQVDYFEEAAAPFLLLPVSMVVYLVGGGALIVGVQTQRAAIALAAMVYLMSLALLTNFNGEGVGDYPSHLHGAIIQHQWLVNLAILATLLLMMEPAPESARVTPEAQVSGVGLSGRILLGTYFLSIALWQAVHVQVSMEMAFFGALNSLSRSALGIGICLIEIVGGTLLILGRIRFSVIAALITVTLFLAINVNTLGGDTPLPLHVQAQQWIAKLTTLCGLLTLWAQKMK